MLEWCVYQDFTTTDTVLLGLSFFFIIGAACPVILWLLTRRYPNTILSYLKYVLTLSMKLCWFICLPPSSFPCVPQKTRNSCGLTFCSLIFSGVGSIPPATPVNYVPWAIIGFIFQYVVRRKHFSYWAKYNYVLSAALDAGTAIGLILVYFWSVNCYRSFPKAHSYSLQYPMEGNIGKNTIQQWWGNQVYRRTLDWEATPLRKLPVGSKFG